MRITIKFILPAICAVFLLAGCDKEYEDIATVDKQNIADYVKQNNLNMQVDATTGIYYNVTKAGNGPDLDFTKQIPILYTIRTLDGKYSVQDTFASTNRYGNFFGYFAPPTGVTTALRDAVKSFLKKEGGEIRVILPSNLAYGKAGNQTLGIDGNQPLDFKIKVLVASELDKYDDALITKYMQANNLTGFTKTTDGIYYKIASPGTGSSITKDSTITATYTGKLLNGVVFDQGTAVSLGNLFNTISAWVKIVPLVKEGGSLRMIVPSKQAYGNTSTSLPFQCLDFDLTITDVSP